MRDGVLIRSLAFSNIDRRYPRSVELTFVTYDTLHLGVLLLQTLLQFRIKLLRDFCMLIRTRVTESTNVTHCDVNLKTSSCHGGYREEIMMEFELAYDRFQILKF